MRTPKLGRAGRLTLAAGAIASLALTTGMGTAGAATATKSQPAVVVKMVNRPPIGKMLATTKGKGRSLYTNPAGCSGACLQVWPPLLMPAGTNMPEGAKCLATIPFGTNQLQVTYNGQPLYTFVSDKGASVKGNGVGGFSAAKKVAGCG